MLNELLDQREKINQNILKCFTEKVNEIKFSADNMIECATNMTGQGYISFINSRNDFFNKVDKLQEEITKNSERRT